MPCCGGKRKDQPYVPGLGYTMFRYEGQQSPVKVLGGVTGRTYRFDGYGSVVPIDSRDAGNVKTIPGMRVVE